MAIGRHFAINGLTTNQQYPTNGIGGVSTSAAAGMARGRVIVHGVYCTVSAATAQILELTKADGTSYSPAIQFGTAASTAFLASYPNLDIELNAGLGFKANSAAIAFLIVFTEIGGG